MQYVAVILIDPILADIEGGVEAGVAALLAPFDGKSQFEPYELECQCSKHRIAREANVIADRTFGDIYDRFRADHGEVEERMWSLFEIYSGATVEERERMRPEYQAVRDEMARRCDEYWGPRERAYADAIKNHPLKDTPDPDCQECGGRGFVSTTANPQGRWKQWRIGGQFTNFFGGEADELSSDELGSEQPSFYKRWGWDVLPVRDILENPEMPGDLITPDGKWHYINQFYTNMDIMDVEAEEKEWADWPKRYRELLEANSNSIAVVCDLELLKTY